MQAEQADAAVSAAVREGRVGKVGCEGAETEADERAGPESGWRRSTPASVMSKSGIFNKQHKGQCGYSTVNPEWKQGLDYVEPCRPLLEFKF